MTKKWRTITLAVALLMINMIAVVASADETKQELEEKAGFTYKISHPENQIGDGVALNLKMAPGQKQTVAVAINNLGTKELTLQLSVNGVRTNPNGGLEYGPSMFKKDKSMVADLPDLVTLPEELTIPANTTAELPLQIDMPETAYDGIVTGGIQIIEKTAAEKESKGTTIVNKIAYLFGVTLQMTDESVSPALELNKVYAGQANYRNSIYLDLANVTPIKLSGLRLEAEITKKGQKEVLFDSKKNNMEMAPNTVMSYPISLSGEAMSAGDYTAHVMATVNGKEWQWTEAFTITTDEAESFNQEDVTLVQERGLNWQLIALITGGSLVVLLGGYFGSRFLLKKKATKKSKRGKR